jgi:hypothetical protein
MSHIAGRKVSDRDFLWSSRYLDAIEPESRRRAAKRGITLHGAGLAGAVIFFPLVLLSGIAS